MFLKRLTCQGFKSFADKVDFDFRPGVTGIVGPNGCGKSNVVDAIKWVLGDQSPRSLRGRQMLDVIFNGSGTRRSAGMAQVDLAFENTDRRLGADADEVVITRRLYRSGDSEYLINNEAVRLKDIRELFMDTGIGVSAYSIIEQGKVDVLLQANPQERRVIFDEAAGISRYKARKREAERKLERVEQNLLRVEDIVAELEKRLRSIKYQAGKARNFQEYDRQLREKRATFSLAEYHRLTQRGGELDAQIVAMTDESTTLRTAISSAETRSSALDAEILKLETDLRQVEQQQHANTSEMTANRERIQAAHQRLEELAAARARAQQRLATERQRAARLRQQIEAEDTGVKAVETELQTAHAAVDELTIEDRELSKELNTLRAASENEKAGIIELVRRTAQLHNEVAALESRRQRLEGDKTRLSTRSEQIRAELESLLAVKAEIAERAERIAELIENQTYELEVRRQEAQRLDATRAELNGQLAAAKEHRSGLLSRRNLLVDLERKREGVDSGVRELLHRKEQDGSGQTFGYVRGMIADLIAVDVSHAVLIETALGEFDQYVVVDDSQAFYNDAPTFADFPGRVQAVCLDRLPPFMDGRDFSAQEGFVDYAMNMVRYPQEAEHLVRRLLGKTIVVRTLTDAQRMAGQNPPSYRYVTLAGELLDPDGLCQLGPAGARTGLISRRSELREIDAQIAEVDERISTMTRQLQETTGQIANVEQLQQQLRDAKYEASRTQVENNAAASSNASSIQRLVQEQPLIANEVQSIEMQLGDAAEATVRNGEALARVEQDKIDREARIKALDERMVVMNGRRVDLNDRITEAKVKVGQLAQQRSMLADRLRSLRASQQASDDAVRSSAQEADDSAHRMVMAERSILTAESRLSELFAAKERLTTEILSRQHTREQMRYEMEQLAARIKTDRTALSAVEEQLHARQMELQSVRIHVEELTTRVRDELGIALADVYATYSHEEQDWAALEAQIEELKEKIRRLGNVNLDAIAEQDELEKRSEFLTTQRDDLRKSKNQLVELIEQLNQECRQRFAETFETVRGHFQELFRKLFGGGKADVMLEQPPEGQAMDVLETGIEIQARPPGKELQSISLMSGGEKTMTAIALLLAIFRSRPSPFAIMDEVDAALDEANNERFNRIIQEFLDHSQFLIITHSKRTMTVADVLYGVTMQEAGVSKRVSVRFDRDEPEAAVA